MSDWCTIESDPGVFTSLIESFGVQNAQLTELWSLDDESLAALIENYGKVHGLVFLFKWQPTGGTGGASGSTSDDPSSPPAAKPLSFEEAPQDLFFAKQVTTNACATQALLSILLNVPESEAQTAESTTTTESTSTESNSSTSTKLILGDTLSSLKSFTTSFPADLKGEAIGASDEIRNAHNSFARKEAFLMDDTKKRIATVDDDVFHFIAYVPHTDGTVYELDGLQSGPIPAGTFTQETTNAEESNHDSAWLSVARQAIQTRIEKYAVTEIKFNCMALTCDKRVQLQSKIKKCTDNEVMIQQLNMELMAEEEQRQKWKHENERRQHNFLPFCMELLKSLSKVGRLQECTRSANERVAARRRQQFQQQQQRN